MRALQSARCRRPGRRQDTARSVLAPLEHAHNLRRHRVCARAQLRPHLTWKYYDLKVGVVVILPDVCELACKEQPPEKKTTK